MKSIPDRITRYLLRENLKSENVKCDNKKHIKITLNSYKLK